MMHFSRWVFASLFVAICAGVVYGEDSTANAFESTAEKAERQARDTAAAAQKIRDEKVKAANDVYKTAMDAALKTLQEQRKRAVAAAVAIYDADIGRFQRKGELDKAAVVTKQKEEFIKKATEENEQLVSEWRKLTSGETSIKPPMEGAIRFGDHWYKLFPAIMTWAESKAYCERFGGHLVTITSKEEDEFVREIARRAGKDVHIGLSDEAQEGKWVWVTGEPTNYTGWAVGEPNAGRQENHAMLFKAFGWRWVDAAHNAAFVCEWE